MHTLKVTQDVNIKLSMPILSFGNNLDNHLENDFEDWAAIPISLL